ncbi:dihydropyrimidinase [Aureimonas sp. SA4125]|uniref:dihydropyrimidinase n=1 Tax=Aureimonas sp. SA4125 TaxID=2826993 RepID=UPI001CC70CFA|nr:dihydropyrimidinase [Aureimonas sp. SA4125]BDA86476.1 dihydropyrimidinase [Aureimonas sp. SA4125]
MHDVLIEGGLVVTASQTMQADVAIREGRIEAVGSNLGAARTRIDARGKMVMPGGVDTHCHVEQISGAGLMNADTFESATRSALCGGTTSIVSFAAQHPGQRLRGVVDAYQALAAKGAMIDHAFHLIVSDIAGDNLARDLPELIGEGHRSIKIFTTYDKVRLADEAILDVLWTAKESGALVCFHAENDGLIRWMTRRLLDSGRTEARFHPLSHPRAAEIEALARMCVFAEFTGQPIMLFHVSTREGVEIVRAARARGVPVVAETCPHYLFMTGDQLNLAGQEAAGLMCSPPQRRRDDQDALWAGLEGGALQVVSSDHAPYRLDATGKFAHGAAAPFNRIANGMPGLELRLPLMFDAMVSGGRLGAQKFVALTATSPAEIFGLTGKGRIDVGADADIAVWDPDRKVTFGKDDLHDATGYNPFAGRTVTGWPETVLSRGEIVVSGGRCLATPGRGRRIVMARSQAMRPSTRAEADELDHETREPERATP